MIRKYDTTLIKKRFFYKKILLSDKKILYFDKKYLNWIRKISWYLCLTFKILLSDRCCKFLKYLMKVIAEKNSQGLQHQNQGNLMSTKLQLLFNRPQKCFEEKKKKPVPNFIFLNTDFFFSRYKKYLLCIVKVNVSIFAPFPSAVVVKTVSCAPQSSFCAENARIFAPVFWWNRTSGTEACFCKYLLVWY